MKQELLLSLLLLQENNFHVTYRNTDRKDYGSYHIATADCDKTAIEIVEDSHIMISREFINNLSSDLHEITVTLA